MVVVEDRKWHIITKSEISIFTCTDIIYDVNKYYKVKKRQHTTPQHNTTQ